VLLALFAAGALVGGLSSWRDGDGRGVLLLLGSPALLVISFVAWGEALYVAPAQADGHWVQVGVASTNAPRFERTSRLWTQPELAQAPNVAVQGRWLAVHPTLLYWSLRYYYEHPEARAELADERAVQRIRTGALLD